MRLCKHFMCGENAVAEGKKLGAKRRCKFLEVSALLDHKVDEVLATVVRDARVHRRRSQQPGSAADRDATAGAAAAGQTPMLKSGCLHRAAFSIFRKLFK